MTTILNLKTGIGVKTGTSDPSRDHRERSSANVFTHTREPGDPKLEIASRRLV